MSFVKVDSGSIFGLISGQKIGFLLRNPGVKMRAFLALGIGFLKAGEWGGKKAGLIGFLLLVSQGFLLGCGGGSGEEVEVPDLALSHGKKLYKRLCVSCHGVNGRGDGKAAAFLSIPPRDFTQGIFKFKSNLEGLPTDADLMRTLEVGIAGTEMSAYARVPEKDRRSLVDYLKTLVVKDMEIQSEAELEDLDGVQEVVEKDGQKLARVNLFEMWGVGDSVSVPDPPKMTKELIARGAELYKSKTIDCARCHGPGGKGDGPSVDENMKDDWGFLIRPRDLTSEAFKGGKAPRDIYLRIVVGIPGTPMPSFLNNLPEEEDRWALVYYTMKIAGLIPRWIQ
ncbi:MAG: cytochrome c [Planctomycetota bacterium]|jgi:cytochrome c oxidase cbb3-type subunit 2|nr:cytochrome c [Planctomycetota bacterium]